MLDKKGDNVDEETRHAIDGIDKRVQKIEALIGTSKDMKEKIEGKVKKDYRGLQGGINLLLEENFFGTPKSMAETKEQLVVKGYHRPKGAVQAALARDFMKKKRILTRIKDEKVYKYVTRK